jgi:hypothetical protein
MRQSQTDLRGPESDVDHSDSCVLGGGNVVENPKLVARLEAARAY